MDITSRPATTDLVSAVRDTRRIPLAHLAGRDTDDPDRTRTKRSEGEFNSSI